MRYQYNDGGRAASGYTGKTNDCVVRAIATATGKPYIDIYNAINLLGKEEKKSKCYGSRSTARGGVYRKTYDILIKRLGGKWVPCMGIGTGCKVHLQDGQLPMGRMVVRVSKHLTAVIDGVIHDTFDCSRGGSRCVYGYYKF